MTQATITPVTCEPLQLLQEHDSYTYYHSLRVAELLERFGEFINLPIQYQDELYQLGALHDIGKVEIPKEILNKKSPLKNEEWELMKEHTIKGYNMLLGEGYSRKILSGILYHHENHDGSGYPFNYKGAQLPLFAQMLRIVDSYDAMTNNRSYQSASFKCVALKEMQMLQGSCYEPSLIKDFVRMIATIK